MTSAEYFRRKNLNVNTKLSGTVALDRTQNSTGLGSTQDNTGATGDLTFTLPAGSPGDMYEFDQVVASHKIQVDGGTAGVFVLAGTAGTAGQTLQNDGTAAGESCQVVCVAVNRWRVRNLVGSHWSTTTKF